MSGFIARCTRRSVEPQDRRKDSPLLFETCSGTLELRHCAQLTRAALRRARFVEATVENVDVQRQIVRAVATDGGTEYDLPYDHLVVALGASTNEQLIPGSSNAFTFKTMADALVLRNHLIEQFERADATSESTTRRGCLTVVVIGGRSGGYRATRRAHGIRG
jgi:NADH dehydrogenase